MPKSRNKRKGRKRKLAQFKEELKHFRHVMDPANIFAKNIERSQAEAKEKNKGILDAASKDAESFDVKVTK